MSLRYVFRIAVALLILEMGITGPVHATTMVYADVERLTTISDIVVHGIISSQKTFYDAQRRITTAWTVTVYEVYKGNPRDSLTFEQWSGTLDGITTKIPGDAVIHIGQEVVLFLHSDSRGFLYLSALGQSTFTVCSATVSYEADSLCGALNASAPLTRNMAIRDLRGIAFYQRSATPRLLRMDALQETSLAELKQRVIEAVGNGKGE